MSLQGKDFKTYHSAVQKSCCLMLITSVFVFYHSSAFLLQEFLPVLSEGQKKCTACAALGLLMSSAVVGEAPDLEPSLLLVRNNCELCFFFFFFSLIEVCMFSLIRSLQIFSLIINQRTLQQKLHLWWFCLFFSNNSDF